MQRVLSMSSTVLFGLSMIAFSFGVAQAFHSATGRQAEGLRFRESIKTIGDVNAGERGEVTITVENPSNRAITILGGSRACYPYCCLTFVDTVQRIPAASQGTIRYLLTASSRAGEFQVPVTLFTDCDGQPELTIELKGRVVDRSPALTSTR